jgi:predicted acylesterase/phospholipase RssA/CRP-like cAMP-binding protein
MSSQARLASGDALRQVAIFANLTDEMRAQLAGRATRLHVQAGAWLFHAGDVSDSLYVPLSGRLEAVIETPEPTVIRILGRGDAFGELAVLTGSPRSASVRARRDSELLKIARDDFVHLLENEPDFTVALSQFLGEKLRNSRALTLITPPIPATIAIVPLHRGLPAEQLADALVRQIGRWHTVAPMKRPGDEAADDERRSLSSRLDRCERTADQVVLLAGEPDVAPEWTSFCLRQADRILALVGDGEHSTRLAGAPTLHGCDIVYCSMSQRHIDTSKWHDALRPRATHWLPVDVGIDAAAQRIARRLTGRSVGIVLSGGGARGLAHIGVLEELTAAGVVIDRVAGCSMGSFIGAQFACGTDPQAIMECCQEELVRRNPWSDYTIPVVAATRGRKLRSMLARVFGSLQIQDLQRAYFCVSADLMSSELIVHDHGRVSSVVAASMCIPGSSPPVVMRDRVLVDGGLFDNLPVETMAAMGEGPIIAVDVTAQFKPPAGTRKGRPRVRRLREGLRSSVVGDDAPHPGLRDTMFRSIVLGSRDTTEAAKRYADLVINPETSSIGLLAFKQLDRARALGRHAARSALESAPDFLSENAAERECPSPRNV